MLCCQLSSVVPLHCRSDLRWLDHCSWIVLTLASVLSACARTAWATLLRGSETLHSKPMQLQLLVNSVTCIMVGTGSTLFLGPTLSRSLEVWSSEV